jgi:hypothetical protein
MKRLESVPRKGHEWYVKEIFPNPLNELGQFLNRRADAPALCTVARRCNRAGRADTVARKPRRGG